MNTQFSHTGSTGPRPYREDIDAHNNPRNLNKIGVGDKRRLGTGIAENLIKVDGYGICGFDPRTTAEVYQSRRLTRILS